MSKPTTANISEADSTHGLRTLLDASKGAVLRRLYPFTSMARLCFACFVSL